MLERGGSVGSVDQCLSPRDKGFAPFQTESFLVGVLACDELLE